MAALRWLRANASGLGVDPHRIAAAGGSAGGHLAMALATPVADHFADPPPGGMAPAAHRPDALLLWNPVLDNGPDGYAFERVRTRWRDFSPAHNLVEGMPPTLVMLGDRDDLFPVATARAVQEGMRRLGARSELVIYPGAGHGFFNPHPATNPHWHATLAEADAFLVSLGWIPPAHRQGNGTH